MGLLSRLVAGNIDTIEHSGEFSRGLKAIEKSVAKHEKEIALHWADTSPTLDARVFSSCSRLILEQSAAALLGRIDPIRMVSIVKGSASVDFKIGYRNASSFMWSKDVIPDTKPGSGFWTQESIGKGVYRALLDGHLADYIFASSHKELQDPLFEATVSKIQLPDWVIELQKFDRGEPVLAKLRILASEAYSTLSKGIHFEFFLGKETTPDLKEIRSSTSKAITVIATAALYTHFSDVAVLKIDRDLAIESFLQIIDKYQHHG